MRLLTRKCKRHKKKAFRDCKNRHLAKMLTKCKKMNENSEEALLKVLHRLHSSILTRERKKGLTATKNETEKKNLKLSTVGSQFSVSCFETRRKAHLFLECRKLCPNFHYRSFFFLNVLFRIGMKLIKNEVLHLQ